MQAISTSEELKIAISLIQIKQIAEGRLLKEQFLVTCETLNPGSPKFLVAGSPANFLRKVLTVTLQSGITRIISKR